MTTLDIRPSQGRSGAHGGGAGTEQAGPDQYLGVNHACLVGSVVIHPSHESRDAQGSPAGVEQAGVTQCGVDTQPDDAGSVDAPVLQGHDDLHVIRGDGGIGSSYEGALLALVADTVDDLEKVRIASENRLRQMTGLGLDEEVPAFRALLSVTDGLRGMEHQSVLSLKRALRAHPLGPWVKRTVGVGEKQGARLIAAVGDPYWNFLHNRPRTVGELRSYCGLGDAAKQVRRRGQKSNWSATAKTRAFLIAESCVKHRHSPYRAVYDTGRVKYADSLHQQDCHRCGPKNKPALSGTPLSLGHQHARAMRLVMKAVLKDLWRESARLHGVTTDPAQGVQS